ncbi:phosphatase [Nodosilinea sp. FACHB-131]|uniref:beta-lactamase hydrolase domain-containing protein n=1 Tax=Cyanophyceae TaxID=3028117 RepID=UPI001682CCFA|nr:sulfur transferase domain-containing protein [Nodosilinea sp. FACHB-131]MBD1874388.1 phosphatase [Nodosilinea sp. FACHB-131]
MTDNIPPVNQDYSSAGQLSPEQIQALAEQGFQAVLNVRSPAEPDSLADEADHAAAAGLGYAQAPVSPTVPDGEALTAALAALDALPKPVLVHCRGGGRATAVALAAIATQEQLSRDAFLEQAAAHGLGPEQPQIQQFLRDYYGAPVPDQQEVG